MTVATVPVAAPEFQRLNKPISSLLTLIILWISLSLRGRKLGAGILVTNMADATDTRECPVVKASSFSISKIPDPILCCPYYSLYVSFFRFHSYLQLLLNLPFSSPQPSLPTHILLSLIPSKPTSVCGLQLLCSLPLTSQLHSMFTNCYNNT